MKHKLLKIITVATLSLTLSHAEEKKDSFDITIGAGIVSSSGYEDYINDAYFNAGSYIDKDVYGWLDLYAGLEYRPFSQFGIIGGCDVWLNGLESLGGVIEESSFVNMIIIPSLYGQLYLTKSRLFYINAGVNFPIPDAGSSYFEFDSAEIGYGVNIGVELFELLRIEGGYTYIPVTVKKTSSNPTVYEETDYDFGGPQIRLLLAF
jgi:hypothetical protein